MDDGLSNEERQELQWLNPNYQIIAKIGEGTFSKVYKAHDHNQSGEKNYVAIKNITRTSSPQRILDELKYLTKLRGVKNVIPLLNCMRHEDQIAAVFPFFKHDDFKTFMKNADITDIKYYMFNLLMAIRHVHENFIIHRDIKPGNFLYNSERREGALIDFGLAQSGNHIHNNKNILKESNKPKKHSVLFFNALVTKSTQPPGYYVNDSRPQMKAQRSGTRGFRAPEVLLRVRNQDNKIDIWSAGVIFLTLLTKKYPFFESIDDIDSLVELATIFGHNEMRRVAKYYERTWRSNITEVPDERIPFERIVYNYNPEINTQRDAFDLLNKLLDPYSLSRIDAEDAMNHPFFDSIRI
ncbi:putative cell division control protein 7 like protein 2 [Dictyocoela muelleri]|nr:putative cell division control protein 7 like protein 2 [Dictyocoela muelleri]